MAVESGLTQPLWITLLGMAVTFGALALVMVAMVLLTRLVCEARSPAGENAEGTAVDGATGEDERVPSTSAAGGGDEPGVGPEDGVPAEPAGAVDLELPAGTEMAELLAAVVAVAAARQLAQQRHSARVWLRAEPRSLVSPWQLVARGWQMDRWRR
jgi:Na+-transporting methylmalonyl-CoA/oxaloacetate decarboxylase gamma subunit